MAIENLKKLYAHIIDSEIVKPEQVAGWSEEGEAKFSVIDLGSGFELCRYRYNGYFEIKEYSDDANVLIALITSWIIEHDNDRDRYNLKPPEIDVRIVSDKAVNLDIEIEFEESVRIVEDDNGKILYRGKRYSTGDPEIRFATEICVGDSTGFDPVVTSGTVA